MAGFTATAENLAADAVGGNAVSAADRYISLHTADPSGANEVTGGTYARKICDFAAASSSASVGGAVVFDVPAGTTISHWGVWTALTAGTLLYGGGLPASETFGSNGTYTLTPTITASD